MYQELEGLSAHLSVGPSDNESNRGRIKVSQVKPIHKAGARTDSQLSGGTYRRTRGKGLSHTRSPSCTLGTDSSAWPHSTHDAHLHKVVQSWCNGGEGLFVQEK